MNEEMVQQMMAAAERLATATETLDRVLGTGRAAGNAECKSGPDRGGGRGSITQTTEQRQAAGTGTDLQQRVVDLEKSNADLKAQASRMALRRYHQWCRR